LLFLEVNATQSGLFFAVIEKYERENFALELSHLEQKLQKCMFWIIGSITELFSDNNKTFDCL